MAERDEQIEELRRARAGMLAAQEAMQARIAEVDRLLEKRLPEDDDGERRVKRSAVPVRAKVLDALDDFAWPAYTREIGRYIEARTGDKVAPARFGVLARDERNSFVHGRARPVYLGFALTAPRGEAIKRLLVRSDWELERRIVAPTTGRVQHLTITIRFCELARELEDLAVHPDRMRFLAADHARDLPGVTVRHGSFELDAWREIAAAELDRVRGRDEELRAEAARRLRRLPEHALLFGVPEVIDGGRSSSVTAEGRA